MSGYSVSPYHPKIPSIDPTNSQITNTVLKVFYLCKELHTDCYYSYYSENDSVLTTVPIAFTLHKILQIAKRLFRVNRKIYVTSVKILCERVKYLG